MRYYVAFQILEKMQKLILILQDSIITNNNIFMLSIKSDKAWLKRDNVSNEALSLLSIKIYFVLTQLIIICILNKFLLPLHSLLRICIHDYICRIFQSFSE